MSGILDKFDLAGRVAIVTGGAGLLGKEFCRTLAEAGSAVVVADLNEDALIAQAQALQKDVYTIHGGLLIEFILIAHVPFVGHDPMASLE